MARSKQPRAASLPAPWSALSKRLVLWHGTLQTAADDIAVRGVDRSCGRASLDFGRGFYTTTNRRQADRWAQIKHANLAPAERSADRPALLRFSVPFERFAQLDSLLFVRGDIRHEMYWSFVHHCRSGSLNMPRTHLHPGRSAPDDWYDVVGGPLAAAWPPRGRIALADTDQFSFHTAAAIDILDDVVHAGFPHFRIILL
jgi:hypothetical protein